MNLFYRKPIIFLLLNSLSLFANEKIDPAIDLKKSGFIPVFVRMSDQLITRAGEYERLSVTYSENCTAGDATMKEIPETIINQESKVF